MFDTSAFAKKIPPRNFRLRLLQPELQIQPRPRERVWTLVRIRMLWIMTLTILTTFWKRIRWALKTLRSDWSRYLERANKSRISQTFVYTNKCWTILYCSLLRTLCIICFTMIMYIYFEWSSKALSGIVKYDGLWRSPWRSRWSRFGGGTHPGPYCAWYFGFWVRWAWCWNHSRGTLGPIWWFPQASFGFFGNL